MNCGFRSIDQRLFLLTPLREGRRIRQSRDLTVRQISTHAPAGGATKWQKHHALRIQISTHAPAGGATSGNSVASFTLACISTHAPAGGATRI